MAAWRGGGRGCCVSLCKQVPHNLGQRVIQRVLVCVAALAGACWIARESMRADGVPESRPSRRRDSEIREWRYRPHRVRRAGVVHVDQMSSILV
jgi:hypothetical protein